MDGRPACSLSHGAHANARPDVINMDLVEIPLQLHTYVVATGTIAACVCVCEARSLAALMLSSSLKHLLIVYFRCIYGFY